jgi:death-on-curing protein
LPNTTNNREIYFLTVEDVIRLHDSSIEREGGNPGVKDPVYLESAVVLPQQRVFGQYLHQSIEAMAAAYMFHICQNHPFQDGNKRTALQAAETFLNMNGKEMTLTNEQAFQLLIGVASGDIDKQRLTAFIETQTRDLQQAEQDKGRQEERAQAREEEREEQQEPKQEKGKQIEIRYGWIEDENGKLAHFELTIKDDNTFFLREAPDNRAGKITDSMAYAIADEMADEVLSKGQTLQSNFYAYDRDARLWDEYQLSAREGEQTIFEIADQCPQYELENNYDIKLARSDDERIEQMQRDLEYMKGRLQSELWRNRWNDFWAVEWDDQKQARRDLNATKERIALVKEVEATFKEYLKAKEQEGRKEQHRQQEQEKERNR